MITTYSNQIFEETILYYLVRTKRHKNPNRQPKVTGLRIKIKLNKYYFNKSTISPL